MGCSSSNSRHFDELKNSHAHLDTSQDEDDRTMESLCVAWMEEFGTIKFPSLIGGRRLWYLDEFKVKGSREKTKMWKAAMVDFVDISHDSIHLKLSPKNQKRDRIVDLNTDWGRLALPEMNLSKEQRIKGIPLSDEQLLKAYALLSADYSYEDDMINHSDSSIINENEEDPLSRSGFSDHEFSIGKEIDVRDMYLAKGRKEIKSKLRKAKIIDMTEETIRIHYIGWDDRWDETIYLNQDNDRIRPGGTMTTIMTTDRKNDSSSFVNKSNHTIVRTRGVSLMTEADGNSSPRQIARSKSNPLQSSLASADMAFRNRMNRSGMKIFEVEGDGNCLFRAVAHQLYLDPSRHLELRAACVEHMKKHQERFETFCVSKFDDHLRRLSTIGTWGDDLEIRAMEEILDRPFFIYCADQTKGLAPVPINTGYNDMGIPSLDEVIPIKLSYNGRNHYNSIIDQRFSLPLPPRRTKFILQSRVRLFQIEKKKKMKVNPDTSEPDSKNEAIHSRDSLEADEDDWSKSSQNSHDS